MAEEDATLMEEEEDAALMAEEEETKDNVVVSQFYCNFLTSLKALDLVSLLLLVGMLLRYFGFTSLSKP